MLVVEKANNKRGSGGNSLKDWRIAFFCLCKGGEIQYKSKDLKTREEEEMINRIFPDSPEAKEALRKFAEQVTGWQIKDSNIKKIKVRTFSDRIKRRIDSDVSVGEELDSNLSNSPHESVLAIFEGREEYLVVTPNRNNPNGTLYFFEPGQILSIER